MEFPIKIKTPHRIAIFNGLADIHRKYGFFWVKVISGVKPEDAEYYKVQLDRGRKVADICAEKKLVSYIARTKAEAKKETESHRREVKQYIETLNNKSKIEIKLKGRIEILEKENARLEKLVENYREQIVLEKNSSSIQSLEI